jgi:beta-lactamase superfamily II metal-dependent hydrolase
MKASGVLVVPVGQGCFPYPAREFVAAKGSNAIMTVAHVPLVSGAHYLNMGDLERKYESAAAKWAGAGAGLWYLKISHHGSGHSTSKELLQIVRPKEVLISAGVGNRFGHPAAKVLSIINNFKALRLLRTDMQGCLKIK